MTDDIVTKQQTSEGWHQVTSIIYFVLLAPLMLYIFCWHTFKMYQDLFTKERKSLVHRRNPPELTINYKLVAYLTFLSVLFWTTPILASTFSFFLTNNTQCDIEKTVILTNIQIAKSFMYLVFLARLYRVYETSAYSYPLKCIWFFVILVILYGIAAFIIIIWITATTLYEYADGDPYPNWCSVQSEQVYWLMGPIIYIEDLAVAIGFITASMIPLRKTLNAIKNAGKQSSDSEKAARKIVYAATKTAVLLIVQTISTLIFGTLVVTVKIPMLYNGDNIINALCIMFMTDYYPDKKYYQRYCKLCILCCDKVGTVEYDQGDDGKQVDQSINKSNTKPSIDTHSQLRVTGSNIKVQYHAVYDNDNDNDDNDDNDVVVDDNDEEQKLNENDNDDNDNADNNTIETDAIVAALETETSIP